jgi:RNA polymerase sigma factor (sigma-70 family)
MPTDLELLARYVADRDESAFTELVGRHAALVRGACRRILADPGASDDAAQATFVELAGHAQSLATRPGWGDTVAGWLYRVAVNSALQSKRTARVRRRHETAFARTARSNSSNDETAELLGILDEELTALPSRYQAPLVLCHLQGKTQQQAAQELGLTYATIRRRLEGAKRQLQSRLARRGFVLSAAAAAALWKQAAATAGDATSQLPSATAKSATTAVRLAQTSPTWIMVLRARLAAVCSRVGAAGTIAKLSTAAALVAIGTGVIVAFHYGERGAGWVAAGDGQEDREQRAGGEGRESSRVGPDPGHVRSGSAGAGPPSAADDRWQETCTVGQNPVVIDGSQETSTEGPDPGHPRSESSGAGPPSSLDDGQLVFPDVFARQQEPPEVAPKTQPPHPPLAMRHESDSATGDEDPAKDDLVEPALDKPAKRKQAVGVERREKKQRAEKPDRGKSKVKRDQANVVELYGIPWQPSVERALAAAQGVVSDERDKPVFCLRVLGDLAGFM